jgi:predicted exporter
VNLLATPQKRPEKSVHAFWKGFSILWTLLVGVLSAWMLFTAAQGIRLDADLLALLPQDKENPARVEATSAFMRQVSQKVALLVSAPTFEVAAKGSDAFAEMLQSTPEFSEVQARLPVDSLRAYHDLLSPHLTQLYSEQIETLLKGPNPAKALSERAARILFSPVSGTVTASLEEDPLLLFADVLSNLPRPPGKLSVRDGYLVAPLETPSDAHQSSHPEAGAPPAAGRVAVVISATLKTTVFDRASQQAASARLDEAKAALASTFPDIVIHEVGALRFAQAMAGSAERDVMLISIGSLIGTIALVLLVFSSPAPLFFSLLSVGVGILVALSSCLLVFGKLHLITLGLGASLIGVCADYSFHFFCHRLAAPGVPSLRVLRSVLPAISIGIFTSIVGFSGLLFVSFPGLREIAVFSIAGMLGSFFSVVAWLPMLSPVARSARPPAALAWCAHALGLAQNQRVRRFAGWIAVASAPVALYGLISVAPGDDIRSLQSPPAKLLQEEAALRSVMGGSDGRRFFVVTGSSTEEVLKRQDDLVSRLRALVSQGALDGFQSVGSFVPSESTQRRRAELLREVVLEQGKALHAGLSELGIPEHTITSFFERAAGQTIEPLSLADWRKSPASLGLRQLWVVGNESPPAAILPLQGIRDEALLRGLARPAHGIFFYDQLADTTDLMMRYRRAAAAVSFGCYLLVFAVLVARYGLTRGARGMLPACASVIATTAALGLLGQPITLFSVLANVIVLGLAIDYSVFLLEGIESQGPTMLAIALSTITTILSFGCLALSSTAVLASFGVTLFVGVATSMCAAPFIIASQGGAPHR